MECESLVVQLRPQPHPLAVQLLDLGVHTALQVLGGGALISQLALKLLDALQQLVAVGIGVGNARRHGAPSGLQGLATVAQHSGC